MPRLQRRAPGFAQDGDSLARHLREDRDPRANYWFFHSNKLDSLLVLESDVVFACAVMLEFRPDIASFESPKRISANGDDEDDPSFDFLVSFFDGHKELWQCRRDPPTKHLPPAGPDGTATRLITGAYIDSLRIQFDNSLMLSGAMTATRAYDHAFAYAAVHELCATRPSVTLRQVLSFPGIDPAFLLAAMAELLADGTLQTDLHSSLLTLESQVALASGMMPSAPVSWPGTLTTRVSVPALPAAKKHDEYNPLSVRRRLIPLQYQDCPWPEPNREEIPTKSHRKYRVRKAAVDAYRHGWSYARIQHRFHVSEGEIRRLVSRCVTPCGAGAIHGYYGLIFGRHLKGKGVSTRTSSAPHESSRSGYAYRWTRLLEEVEGLDSLIQDHLFEGDAPRTGRKLDIDQIHECVVDFLQTKHLTPTDYPLSNVDRGRDAVARYVRQLSQRYTQRFIRLYHGEAAAKRARHIGRGLRRIIRPLRPGSFAQLDFYRTDRCSHMSFPNGYGETFTATLPRWYYALLVEEMSSAVLSAFATLEKTPSTDSALECLDRFIHPEAYRKVDLSNRELLKLGPCFAYELLPSLLGNRISVLRLDNAWSNTADSLIRSAVYTFGCAVNFGPTYSWVSRAIVERTIGNIARLSGDTYTGAAAIDVSDLRIALESACAKHNTSPTERLNYSSPVAALASAAEQPGAGLISTPLPRKTIEDSRMLDYVFVAPVRGNLKKGVLPYVQKFRRRYGNDSLSEHIELSKSRGQPVLAEVRIKRYDIRLCQAGLVGGKSLGRLLPDRQQDLCISIRDAMMVGRTGRARKAQRTDQTANTLRRRGPRPRNATNERPTKADNDALAQARVAQSAAIHGEEASRQERASTAERALATRDALRPSYEQEAKLRPWAEAKQSRRKAMGQTPQQEPVLRRWTRRGDTQASAYLDGKGKKANHG